MGRKEQRSRKRREGQRRKKEARRRKETSRAARGRSAASPPPRETPSGNPQTAAGIQHYREGRYDQAIAALQQALQTDPFDAVAHNALGMTHKALGQLETAVGHYRTAIEIQADYAEAHNNLAVAQRMLGRLDEAEVHCRKAVELQPDLPAALNNLGNTLTQLGRAEEAIDCFRRLLELQPDLPAAHNNLGLALSNLDRPAEERDCYERAIALAPGFAEAHFNLGNVLRRMHRLDEAVRHFHLALRHRPLFAAAQASLGQALADQGKMSDAVGRFQQAVALRPRHAQAHLGLGNAYQALDRIDDAIASYQQAVRANPSSIEGLANLGNALQRKGEVEAARACFDEVRRRQPEEPLWRLRIASLCPTVFPDRPAMDRYLEQLQQTARELAAAPLHIQLDTLLPLASPAPYNLQFFAGDLRPVKEAFAAVFAERFSCEPLPPTGGRPRIGWVVFGRGDRVFLRSMGGVIDALAAEGSDCFVFCTADRQQWITSKLRNDAIRVVPLPATLDAMADQIRPAKLDVLYHWEIGTGTASYLLPFLKLARVQCTSWGTQLTSGIPQVDIYLSSRLIESEGADDHYTEQLVRLDSLLSYQRPIERPGSGRSRSDFGLRDDQHVYLCPQHLGKFHPDFDALLGEILRRDPQGLLIAIQDRHGVVYHQLRARFERTMPDVADRIVFVPYLQRDLYLDLLAVSDVVLDPPHFSGGNTTYDALALGLPVVTLPSPFQRGRYTLGCYRRIGLDDAIVSTPDEYVETAIALAGDAERLGDVRQRIEARGGQLFEDRRVIEEHLRAFAAMVDRARAE